MPTIAVIALGGTIASRGADRLDLAAYPDAGILVPPDAIIAEVPEVAEIADLEVIQFRSIISVDIQPSDWLDLAHLIAGLANRPAPPDGIVITHGTASLEETAYFLHLATDVDLPIVVTGSQRPLNGMSTDAHLNFYDAVNVACHPGSADRGTLVVFNNEIHSPRHVRKTSTFRLQTFHSPVAGLLGTVDAGVVEWLSTSDKRHGVFTVDNLPRVDIVLAYAGADGSAVRALVAAGARGLVSGSLPPGMVPSGQVAAFNAAAEQGVVVALSTRGGTGRILPMNVVRPTRHLLASDLTPQQARVLLMLALASTNDAEQIQAWFDDC